MEDLANATSSSARQLQRPIGDLLGPPPKAALRIARLNDGLRRLAQGQDLAQVASLWGFSHFPHLARELTSLMGLSPAGVRLDLVRHEGLPWRLGTSPNQIFTQST